MNVTNPPEVANCPMYPFRYNRSRHSTSNVTCSLSSSGMLGITEILRNQENLSLVGLRSKTSLDIGFRSQMAVLFNALPAMPLKLNVRDENGLPTVAAFTIRDSSGRLYPNPAKRLAPDFFFQPQVYR